MWNEKYQIPFYESFNYSNRDYDSFNLEIVVAQAHICILITIWMADLFNSTVGLGAQCISFKFIFFSMKTCSKFYFYRNSIDWADNLIKLNRCLVHADLINRWFFYFFYTFYTRFHFQRVCVCLTSFTFLGNQWNKQEEEEKKIIHLKIEGDIRTPK